MHNYFLGTGTVTIDPPAAPLASTPRNRGNMTMRRLAPILRRARDKMATPRDMERAMAAVTQRLRQRGPSKLARRLRRKAQLGMAGAF